MRSRHASRRIKDAAAAMRRSRELMQRDHWTQDQLRTHQRQRLAWLVRYAKAHSAFYRGQYGDIDTDGQIHLEHLPAIDKPTVMAHFDDVVTDPALRLADLGAHLGKLRHDELYLGRYRVTSTGGSTGSRGVFVAGPDEWHEYLAGLVRINEYMGLRPRLPRRRRVAMIAAARPLHVTYRMSRSLDVGAHRVLRLDATTPVDELVEPLNRHQPEFLYSYPSILALLAIEQAEGRLRIAPSTIASSGETHTEDLQRTVRAVWDADWFQIYGATEAPFLAAHCDRHTGLHLFEDHTIVEVVDEHDQPVAPGQPGHRLLVTNLVNHTLPLIRYAVSDMVTPATQPCPCGRPFRLLRSVEGRNDDIIRLPAAGGGLVAVHPLALRSVMAGIAELKQYRILAAPPHLHIDAALRSGAPSTRVESTIAAGLRDKLAALGALPLHIDVTLVDRIDGGRDAAGKFKVVESRPAAPSTTHPERTG